MAEPIEEVRTEALSLVAESRALRVVDRQTYAMAGELLAKRLAPAIKRAHELIDPVCTSTDKAHKDAVAMRKAIIGPLEAVAVEIKAALGRWDQEQARIRRQAEENARLAAEAETRRLEAERVAEAEELAKAGDVEAGVRLLDAPPPLVLAPPLAPVATKVEGLSGRVDWTFEIVDANLIPRKYLIPDEVAIRKVVRALGAEANIPGVRAIERPVYAVRTA